MKHWVLVVTLALAACGRDWKYPVPAPSVAANVGLASAWLRLASCAEGAGYRPGAMPRVIPRPVSRSPRVALACCLPGSEALCHAGGTADQQGDWNAIYLVTTCTTLGGTPHSRRLAYWWHEAQHTISWRNGDQPVNPDGTKWKEPGEHTARIFGACANPYPWW